MSKSKKVGEIFFRHGYRYAQKVDAKDAYEVIEKIRRQSKTGEIDPRKIVDAARPEDSKIHGGFEWDDSIAAEEYRVDQARSMERSLVMVYKEYPDAPIRVIETRTINVVKEDGTVKPKRVYMRMQDILNDPEARLELVTRALNELISVRKKYAHLQELSAIWRELENVNDSVLKKELESV